MTERKNQFIIEEGSPLPLGVTVEEDRVNFSVETGLKTEESLSVLIYDNAGKEVVKIDFPKGQRLGDVSYMGVAGIDVKKYESYRFVPTNNEGNERCVEDKRAKRLVGREQWADSNRDDIRYGFVTHDFDWQGDVRSNINRKDLIIYRLHVRGFTMHESSAVGCRGTFGGIIEKIPYLKELGVNYVELMPAYEFDELSDIPGKINYWGYTKGNYMAPKEAYAKKEAVTELKELVRALHKEGIELGMEFYFVPETNKQFIVEVLRYWAADYHVDGFHVNADVASVEFLKEDPLLKGCKLFGDEWNGSFMYDIRSFLKGDVGKLESFVWHMFNNPAGRGAVNYLAAHDSFTVNDMVSYQMKRNEANGEDNRDGDNYNCTWNCGAEGATLKKAVRELRLKQMKNAWTMLMFSQGIPMLMAGDEFGKTAKGNNNPYCQDNELSWLNWHLIEKNSELFEFVKMLIGFRKEHVILHMDKALKQSDWKYLGYPDVSLHGAWAWKPDLSWDSRQTGIMYNEMYSKGTNEFIYLAVNMHWEEQILALPNLPVGFAWECRLTTDAASERKLIGKQLEGRLFTAVPRSICVFVASDNKSI